MKGEKNRGPLQGASMAKGIVLEKVYVYFCQLILNNFSYLFLCFSSLNSGIESKQPNSAIRKAVRCQLVKNGKKVTAFCPMDGTLLFIEENVSITICDLVNF